MAGNDAETLQAQVAEANERAARAEAALSGMERARAAGIPEELCHLFVGSEATDEEIARWLEVLDAFVEETKEKLLRERRPDLFRGRNMIVQHAPGTTSPGQPPRQNGRRN